MGLPWLQNPMRRKRKVFTTALLLVYPATTKKIKLKMTKNQKLRTFSRKILQWKNHHRPMVESLFKNWLLKSDLQSRPMLTDLLGANFVNMVLIRGLTWKIMSWITLKISFSHFYPEENPSIVQNVMFHIVTLSHF